MESFKGFSEGDVLGLLNIRITHKQIKMHVHCTCECWRGSDSSLAVLQMQVHTYSASFIQVIWLSGKDFLERYEKTFIHDILHKC